MRHGLSAQRDHDGGLKDAAVAPWRPFVEFVRGTRADGPALLIHPDVTYSEDRLGNHRIGSFDIKTRKFDQPDALPPQRGANQMGWISLIDNAAIISESVLGRHARIVVQNPDGVGAAQIISETLKIDGEPAPMPRRVRVGAVKPHSDERDTPLPLRTGCAGKVAMIG